SNNSNNIKTNTIPDIEVKFSTNDKAKRSTSIWTFSILYHLGRISSYMFAGLIAASLGMLGYNTINHPVGILIGQIVAASFMLALGLYVSKIWQGLLVLEKIGSYFWRLIAPFAQNILPINCKRKAFLAGILWGWLPCGMVYTVLIWSLSSGGLLNGAIIMLAFGLGTLPLLLSISLFSFNAAPFLHNKIVSWVSGSLLITLSLWMLVSALTGHTHQH
ncbi:hypothetical protein MNBD_GAMMA12-3119, partial [hydrothermal vent metagenome]